MDGGVADPEDPALQCASDAQLGVLLAPPEEIGSVLDDLEERFGTVATWLEREAGFGAGCAQNLQSNTLTPLFGELVAWQWSLLLDSAGAGNAADSPASVVQGPCCAAGKAAATGWRAQRHHPRRVIRVGTRFRAHLTNIYIVLWFSTL